MKLEKKHYTYIFWGIATLILLGGGFFVWWNYFKDNCDPANPGYTKKGKISDKCFGKAEDPNTITTPPPLGCIWTSDNTFPLKKCMLGNKIKALQTALGFTGEKVDGKFGTTDTLPAVQNKFGGRSEVTQAEYEALINPPASGGGSNYANLKKALAGGAKDFSGGIYYLMQGQNFNYRFEFYTNGRFVFSRVGGSGYIKKGNYKDGGKEMIVDAGESYEEGTVILNMQEIVKDFGQ